MRHHGRRSGEMVGALLALLAGACTGDLGSGRGGGDGGARDAGGATNSGSTMDAARVDAGAGVDGGPGTDAATGVDAPGPTPDAGADGGALVCRPEPRDCSPAPVMMEDYCVRGTSCYLGDVQAAVRATISAHPEWFDSTGSCSIILDVGSFMDDVAARIVARGVCAIRDPNAPDEEVTLKYSNVFTENFDIVASTGCARYGDPIYTSTCFPAWW